MWLSAHHVANPSNNGGLSVCVDVIAAIDIVAI